MYVKGVNEKKVLFASLFNTTYIPFAFTPWCRDKGMEGL